MRGDENSYYILSKAIDVTDVIKSRKFRRKAMTIFFRFSNLVNESHRKRDALTDRVLSLVYQSISQIIPM